MSANPTSLQRAGYVRRVDAELGAWLARAFPDSAPAVTLAAALAARAVADGHSALALDQARAWLAALGEGKLPALPEVADWIATLQQASAVHVHDRTAPAPLRPLVLDPQGRVYLRRYFEYERQLAQSLITRAQDDLARSPVPGPWPSDLDPAQSDAIATALAHRFTLVTGGPGTGKTWSVARMLAALAEQSRATPLRIALAAPTGKAATRLGESLRAQLGQLALPDAVANQIPRDAQTLHRLLGISPWRPQPHFDHVTPLPFDVVVVDEVSMVDLPLMAKLAAAVSSDARLILLGDPDQLSAVEAGNVLGALVEAATNGPLQACHVALTRSHRFGADSALGALATAIARGDAEAAVHALENGGDVALADDARHARLVDAAAQAYQPILDAADPTHALRAARDFRVLTALRHGPAGCLALDAAIAARLQRAAGVRADARHWRGRLLLVTANRPELGLYNGDTGVIWPDTDGTLKAWFEDGNTGAPRALPVAALPPHEGAFALTVHKAQGSEFERIALVSGPDSAVLTRELLYTGVTRARAGVVLYSTCGTLRAGIQRRTLRMTGLADRLRETVGT